MITRQETMQSQNYAPQKKSTRFSAWRGLFRVLDKLSLKKQLTRFFIFHPPKPTYDFVTTGLKDQGSDPVWEFRASNMGKLNNNPHIKAHAYKLYREKTDKTYMTPLIWLFNEKSKSDYIVLYSHGNSSDLGTAYSSAVTFSIVFNMSVIVYDYTGYGLAPHKPSEKNLYDDIESVLSFIVTFLDYPLDKVILCGFSLGSGPTVEMAARYKSIPFMILLAPLASCLTLVEGEEVNSGKHDIFANIDKIPEVACDIIFVHGLNDGVIPSHHSSMMFQRYIETHSGPKNNVWLLEVEDTDHHQLVQELADPKTEFRGLFMHYFEFLVENNHTMFNETEGRFGAEWEDEIKNTIEKVRRKTDVTISAADGVEEVQASFKETGLLNKMVFTENYTDNDEREVSDRDDTEEQKEQKTPAAERIDLRKMTQSCFKRTVLGDETARLRNVFKNITVNKPSTKRKNSRKMYEEQFKSIKIFL